MPLVQITLIEGRDEARLQDCIRKVARTVHETLGTPLETVRVVLQQVPSSHWGVGDRTREDIDREKAAMASSPSPGSP